MKTRDTVSANRRHHRARTGRNLRQEHSYTTRLAEDQQGVQQRNSSVSVRFTGAMAGPLNPSTFAALSRFSGRCAPGQKLAPNHHPALTVRIRITPTELSEP